MSDSSNRDIIINALHSLPGDTKPAGEWLMVCCPFHPERRPSCGVNLSEHNLGWFHCFSCGEFGGWNKLAEHAGLPTVEEWKNSLYTNLNLIDNVLEDELLGTKDNLKQLFMQLGTPEAQLWPEAFPWRGFSGRAVSRAGGYVAQDRFENLLQVVFVVQIAGKVRGAVRARYEPVKGQSNYFTSKGAWVSKYGLLFYHVAQKLIKKNKLDFIVLVEGPRDALRLLINGIPACAILGATSMSTIKANLILGLGISTVYAIPDNDEGGKVFWMTVKKYLKPTGVALRRYLLPSYEETGDKVDPGNMSWDLLSCFADHLTEEHGFFQPENLR